MLWTNNGYNCSVIFSLLAKSRALSKGILCFISNGDVIMSSKSVPDSFEVHRPNLDHMPSFLALQDTITPSSRHASNIEKLGAIDHVIVCPESQFFFATKAGVAKEAYRLVGQRIHLWLLLESTCCLHLPTTSLSPEVSYQVELVGQKYPSSVVDKVGQVHRGRRRRDAAGVR